MSRYEARAFFEGQAEGPLGVAMGSRGCPYPCTFCFKALVPDAVRYHHPDVVVRMVEEHRGDYPSDWAAMTSIAAKVGCTTETLRRWCREEASRRTGPAAQAASDRDRVKALEREVKELRRANEILRKASAYFAQAELDRHGKW